MEAYKVYNSDRMGFEHGEEYFLNPIKAEKEFYKRVRFVIECEELAGREDLDGGPPWKIRTKEPHYKNRILKLDYAFWESWNTPECGEEHDISHGEIILERIKINE